MLTNVSELLKAMTFYAIKLEEVTAADEIISGILDLTITGGNATIRHLVYCDFSEVSCCLSVSNHLV